ncbi:MULTISPECIES: DUF4123 domain-containing protein [Pseudomonas]|uniref:DUF4123 domain-containing protein n=1 Tax=Pseudomonas fluorescens (strain Q2-87) TaxID=1038922 RepID=J2XUX3_PSEFQ|nr:MULTISPECIES: DUF4123 domain-containing protein [Pseudomonas]EJK98788.1 hypothetical protein PflQ2_5603 [Pseudomonas fluorescens Q2-87]
MTCSFPHQWLVEHHRLGRALCVVLDSENERQIRQALLKNCRPDQYLNIFGQTIIADLSDAGPLVFEFDQPGDQSIHQLLESPERNWGWLASLRKGNLQVLAEHWRERLIIGKRPHQALYRFQDNRVLARALGYLPIEAYPVYLGPAISVCYWQGTSWERVDNPAPDVYPVPESPLWLQVPVPPQQVMETRLINARRFLLAEHVQAYARLAERQDPEAWLRATLNQAEAWNWQAPEKLEFLLTYRLQAPAHTLMREWQALPAESPDEHFERVRLMTTFWQVETLR